MGAPLKSTNRKAIDERTTLSGVREAYFRGDFEKCIALCDALRPRDDTDLIETVLLRARSLLPLNRPDQALEALRGLRLDERQRDEHLTLQMLTGTALVALGKTDRGLEVLLRAHRAADDAHPTVRAEISVFLGYAYYRNKQYLDAQRLLDSVPKDADIVYARALEYGGWVAWARGDRETAIDRFRAALICIDGCRRYDRFVEAKALYGIAYLCGELPRLHLWPEIASRATRFDWSANGVNMWRFWLAAEASVITEMLGEMDESTQWASLAESIAPSPIYEIMALCRLAARFGRYRETGANAYFIGRARGTYDSLAREGRLDGEPSLPLALAEELVQGDRPEDAAPLLTYYSESVAPRAGAHADDQRLAAWRMLIEGQLDARRGNRARAERNYLAAFTCWKQMGLLRRAAIVAYHLAVLTDNDDYRTFIDESLREASDNFWVKARIAQSRMEMRLSERHIAVLRLVAEGKTNKEIAAKRGLSFFTARNMVRELLALFGVRTRGELAALAAARGIIPQKERSR